MDIQTRKIKFVQAFLRLQNEETIAHFEKLLKKESKTYSEKRKLLPMSLEELNARIDRSLKDSEHNRVIQVNDLITEIEEWE